MCSWHHDTADATHDHLAHVKRARSFQEFSNAQLFICEFALCRRATSREAADISAASKRLEVWPSPHNIPIEHRALTDFRTIWQGHGVWHCSNVKCHDLARVYKSRWRFTFLEQTHHLLKGHDNTKVCLKQLDNSWILVAHWLCPVKLCAVDRFPQVAKPRTFRRPSTCADAPTWCLNTSVAKPSYIQTFSKLGFAVVSLCDPVRLASATLLTPGSWSEVLSEHDAGLGKAGAFLSREERRLKLLDRWSHIDLVFGYCTWTCTKYRVNET